MTVNEIKTIVEEMVSIRNACREAFFKRYPDSQCPPRCRWRKITARIASFIDDAEVESPSFWLRDLRWLKDFDIEVVNNG